MEKQINNVTKKPNLGRRKIEIKTIENKCSRQVTFTKRRTGLFRKASELCVLTDAKIVIFASSQKGKLFTFGHPNVATIIDRYQGKKDEQYNACNLPKVEEQDLSEVRGRLQDLEAKRNQLKELNKKGVEKYENNGMGKNACWWREVDCSHMGLAELEHFRGLVQELRNNLTKVMMSRAHNTQDFR